MSEDTAADALRAAGVMVSRPGEGHPENELFNQWGVCVGSHGGYGRTLQKAMRACLMCCGLGEWWRIGPRNKHGDVIPETSELLRDCFHRISREHIGRPLYKR